MLVGPTDAWVEANAGNMPFAHPLHVRPAVRSYDFSEPFDDLREWIAERLPEHALDVRSIRFAYRWFRRIGRLIDRILFEGAYEREVDWVFGIIAAAAVSSIALFVLIGFVR